MTKVLTEEVNAFKVRTLNDKYVAIFMDATYIPLKRQTVSKEAIYIAIGIREDGTKEVLSYAIAPTESTYVCNELLQDIYSRGVHDVLLFITDGLKGMKDTIHQIYPKAKYQHCCVHVYVILLIKYVSKIEKQSVMILRLFIKLAQRKRQIPF